MRVWTSPRQISFGSRSSIDHSLLMDYSPVGGAIMKDLHIMLPDDAHEWLRLVAFQSRKSLAQVIRELIEQARHSDRGGGNGK
jgi:hypothetical protein